MGWGRWSHTLRLVVRLRGMLLVNHSSDHVAVREVVLRQLVLAVLDTLRARLRAEAAMVPVVPVVVVHLSADD